MKYADIHFEEVSEETAELIAWGQEHPNATVFDIVRSYGKYRLYFREEVPEPEPAPEPAPRQSRFEVGDKVEVVGDTALGTSLAELTSYRPQKGSVGIVKAIGESGFEPSYQVVGDRFRVWFKAEELAPHTDEFEVGDRVFSPDGLALDEVYSRAQGYGTVILVGDEVEVRMDKEREDPTWLFWPKELLPAATEVWPVGTPVRRKGDTLNGALLLSPEEYAATGYVRKYDASDDTYLVELDGRIEPIWFDSDELELA